MALSDPLRLISSLRLHRSDAETRCVGLPHQLDEDDCYRGYRIPKGTVVMANLWYVFHGLCVYCLS